MPIRLFRLPLRVFVILAVLFLLLVIVAPLVYIVYWPIGTPPAGQEADIRIRFGLSPDSIGVMLARENVVNSPRNFMRSLKLLGRSNDLRAGRFRLPRSISNFRAIKLLAEGPQVYTKITLPEGITARKMAGLFSRQMQVDSLLFMRVVNDSGFASRHGFKVAHLEGYLLPETYYFTYGISESQIIAQLLAQFRKSVGDSLWARSQEMGYTVHELLTLASIVQGEAALESELPLIASVYHNRLRLGIPLQADPTIQYIISNGPRRLLNRDLEIDSPYNTYRYKGLPPGPINNPGKRAIMATIHPAASNYLYFVANGRGGHTFSANFRQHLAAKSLFDQERRRVAQEKRRQQSGQRR